jgi:hypothetical protein
MNCLVITAEAGTKKHSPRATHAQYLEVRDSVGKRLIEEDDEFSELIRMVVAKRERSGT